jgi:hypothetical protein
MGFGPSTSGEWSRWPMRSPPTQGRAVLATVRNFSSRHVLFSETSMAEAHPPSLSRTTTGNTAFYSLVSNASTVQPADMSASVTKTNRAPTDGDPSPEYIHVPNGTSASPTNAKVASVHEKRPTKPVDEPAKKKSLSRKSATTESAGTSGADVVIPASPSHLSREEQLSQHAVGTFAGGAATAVRCALVSFPSSEGCDCQRLTLIWLDRIRRVIPAQA